MPVFYGKFYDIFFYSVVEEGALKYTIVSSRNQQNKDFGGKYVNPRLSVTILKEKYTPQILFRVSFGSM